MDELAASVGVVADTHVPDRAAELHPRLLETLRTLQVTHICHAGDICTQRVLDELAQVAPVTAVRGNRDLLFNGSLESKQSIQLAGKEILILHGHGSMKRYLWDKVQYLLHGYRFERYQQAIEQAAANADITIFGHTHRPVIHRQGAQLLFNPGSACIGSGAAGWPNFGLLRIFASGNVQAEIIPLQGFTLENRQWRQI